MESLEKKLRIVYDEKSYGVQELTRSLDDAPQEWVTKYSNLETPQQAIKKMVELEKKQG